MNSLAEKFGDKLAIVGFPCNQFGHQTNEKDCEFLNTLKYVRPGDGYEPSFPIMTKTMVNGENEDALFTFLKKSLPVPSDDHGGSGDDYISNMSGPRIAFLYTPVRRSDITWNFEKFLVNQEGQPVKRYSPKFETIQLEDDIQKLISSGPSALH
mmetsp:Transcript_14057/g.51071  ORF Transcript_14057/g.51071 Transcript_14057/m.51071 type:complete len:154 (-) Transcript_14057:339-800(-)